MQLSPSLTFSQIKKPSVSFVDGRPLFWQAPPQFYEQTKHNLEKDLDELISHGDEISVTDKALPFSLNLRIEFE
jgi:ubiquitin-activating enzyme E1 C